MIIEIGSYQLNKFGKVICGDTFMSCKVASENRYVAVLSDGLGSGVKASMLSSLTASMAIGFRKRHKPVVKLSKVIMETLPVDSVRNISYSTFSIVDVDYDGDTTVVEYGNPTYLLWRNGEFILQEKEKMEVYQNDKRTHIYVSKFNLLDNDRLIMVTDGVTQSGIGNAEMPFGWEIEGLQEFIAERVNQDPTISARELSRAIVRRANKNDIFRIKDDTSCAIIYKREPRKLLFCTGPPFSEEKDRFLGEKVASFEGKIIISGGITAKIISRELNREIVCPPLEEISSGLPPISKMEGIDLVSEGIITLGRVAEIFDNMKLFEKSEQNAANKIVNLLINADIIDVIVGTRLNEAHHDPNYPLELDIRRNVINRICRTLETKYLKQVNVQFI